MILKRRRVDQSLEIPARKKSTISSSAKDGFQSTDQGKLKMVLGGCYLPKDNPQKPRGEDAHFICAEEQTVGVADGVGGWATKGIDAGEYSRELMKNAEIAVHDQPKGSVDPRTVLNEAFQKTKAEGSSTACIVTLKNQFLHAVNVGDSGFMVFRNKRFLFRSPAQQRRFNCPYQLGNGKNSDKPESAMEFKVNGVVPGDVVVFGSDGLFDNMYPMEIEQVLKEKTTEGMVEPQEVAWMIAKLALYNSMDRYSVSPFAEAAHMAGKTHRGGKIDDITVVVAQIVSS